MSQTSQCKCESCVSTRSARAFPKPYPCYQCNRSYTNKSTLNRHLREECGTLPTREEQEKCENDIFGIGLFCNDFENFYTWDTTNQTRIQEAHVEQQSPKHVKRDRNRVNYEAPFSCYKCGKKYTWTDSLTRHLREGCGILPKHRCRLCGRKFKRKDYLQRHEVTVHKFELSMM
ncbi:gastrula zinc finger protein xFG20-1 isoform X2 [Cephus cinctus]|uniref:Gastrula zinc finger protein xFG20-1 isoform X2 n=1 Tax=Cephus cinctus TaxID=211228 RepID=A0AAJ7RAR9_CEPCN|nr:gastrula zinc finger protein xFG20-1 isoform X2 [Cephus cinctus]